MVDIVRADTTSTATVPVNGYVYGTIEAGDSGDWYAVTLTAGNHYYVNLGVDKTFGNPLNDSALRIYSSSGSLLRTDDDNGANFDAFIDFTPSVSGTYFIGATGRYTSELGDYALSVTDDDYRTTMTVDPGSSITLYAAAPGDGNSYRVPVVINQTYTVSLAGQAGVDNSLSDPLSRALVHKGLTVFDTHDTPIAHSDGTGTLTHTFTATASGYYSFNAYAWYNDGEYGYYTATVSTASPPQPMLAPRELTRPFH